MSDDISILHEIDDALRADKAYQFWKSYGKILLAGCVGIVVLTGISVFWKNHLHEEQVNQTHLMLEADALAADGKFSDALTMLGAADSKAPVEWTEERVALAKLQAAELMLKSGRKDKAVALLKEIVSSSVPTDDAVRDSAVLRLYGLTGEAEFSPADREGRPFAPLVQQIKAAKLIKEGKNKEAAVILKAVIASSPANSPERERATELLQATGESGEK